MTGQSESSSSSSSLCCECRICDISLCPSSLSVMTSPLRLPSEVSPSTMSHNHQTTQCLSNNKRSPLTRPPSQHPRSPSSSSFHVIFVVMLLSSSLLSTLPVTMAARRSSNARRAAESETEELKVKLVEEKIAAQIRLVMLENSPNNRTTIIETSSGGIERVNRKVLERNELENLRNLGVPVDEESTQELIIISKPVPGGGNARFNFKLTSFDLMNRRVDSVKLHLHVPVGQQPCHNRCYIGLRLARNGDPFGSRWIRVSGDWNSARHHWFTFDVTDDLDQWLRGSYQQDTALPDLYIVTQGPIRVSSSGNGSSPVLSVKTSLLRNGLMREPVFSTDRPKRAVAFDEDEYRGQFQGDEEDQEDQGGFRERAQFQKCSQADIEGRHCCKKTRKLNLSRYGVIQPTEVEFDYCIGECGMHTLSNVIDRAKLTSRRETHPTMTPCCVPYYKPMVLMTPTEHIKAHKTFTMKMDDGKFVNVLIPHLTFSHCQCLI